MDFSELDETDDFIHETLDRPLQIVYRDESFVAVFKPAGLIVHRCKSTLMHEPVLLQSLRDQLQCYVYPVHRLDRPTAGLILFGLNSHAAAKMVDLFTHRQVAKYYQALVHGLTSKDGLIDKPLGADLEDDWAKQERVDQSTKNAITQFQTLARYEIPWIGDTGESATFSLLEVKPMTGRSHQIRRHLAHIAHPIVGDQRHGDKTQNEGHFESMRVRRMLLTSMRLDFRHPFSGELHSIVVDRGSEFDFALSKLEPYRIDADGNEPKFIFPRL